MLCLLDLILSQNLFWEKVIFLSKINLELKVYYLYNYLLNIAIYNLYLILKNEDLIHRIQKNDQMNTKISI